MSTMWRWLVFSLTGRVPGQGRQPVERRVVGAEEAAGLGLTEGGIDTYTNPALIGSETVHAVPPIDSGVTPCCGRTPFELPHTDRITPHDDMVTCRQPSQDDTVPVPRDALRRLVEVARVVVAERVRRGPEAVLPDFHARRALGALDDAGLLDQFKEGG